MLQLYKQVMYQSSDGKSQIKGIMLKNLSRLECKIGEKLYHLTCDIDSPLVDVKESLFQFLKYVGFVEDEVKNQVANAQIQQSSEIKEDAKTE